MKAAAESIIKAKEKEQFEFKKAIENVTAQLSEEAKQKAQEVGKIQSPQGRTKNFVIFWRGRG